MVHLATFITGEEISGPFNNASVQTPINPNTQSMRLNNF